MLHFFNFLCRTFIGLIELGKISIITSVSREKLLREVTRVTIYTSSDLGDKFKVFLVSQAAFQIAFCRKGNLKFILIVKKIGVFFGMGVFINKFGNSRVLAL